jgi:hypothetical protein
MIVASFVIITLWWVFWLGSQALFMVDIPILSNWLLASSEPRINFISATVWIVAVNFIALVVY